MSTQIRAPAKASVSISVVLERALAKPPGDRFPTVTAFYQAFDGAIAGSPREKTGFFTMPIHPPGRNLAETLEEDRQLVLLAEELGFT